MASPKWRLPDCAICLEPLETDLHALTCGHVLHNSCATQWLHGAGRKSCPLCKRADTSSYPLFFEMHRVVGEAAGGGGATAAAARTSGSPAASARASSSPTLVRKLRARVRELLAAQAGIAADKAAIAKERAAFANERAAGKASDVRLRKVVQRQTREIDELRAKLKDSHAARAGLEYVRVGIANGFADADSRGLVERSMKGARVALDAITKQYREEVKQRRKAEDEQRRVRRKYEAERDEAQAMVGSARREAKRERDEAAEQVRSLEARLRRATAQERRLREEHAVARAAVEHDDDDDDAEAEEAELVLDEDSGSESESASDDDDDDDDDLEVLEPTSAASASASGGGTSSAAGSKPRWQVVDELRRQRVSFTRGIAKAKPLRPACDNGVWIKRGRDATGKVRNVANGRSGGAKKKRAAPAAGGGGARKRAQQQPSISRWVSSIG